MARILTNVIAFQLTWLACAFGAAAGHGWIGSATALIAIALHLVLSSTRHIDFQLSIVAGSIGFILESALISLGFIQYEASSPLDGLAPAWLVALWMTFATLFGVSLNWLQSRPRLAALLGAIAGGASYYAAQNIGALQFAKPEGAGLALVALIWAVTVPALGRTYRWLQSEKNIRHSTRSQ